MSYSYSTDGDSSDIELVSHPPAAASRPAAATSAHCDAYDSDAPQDYADFFSTAGNAAMLPTSTLGYADQSPPRRQASRSVSRSRQEPRKQTDHSDVIEIGDSDDDDGNDPQEQARQLAKLPRPTGDLRKTQSAPSAVFGGTGSISSNSNAKGKGRLFEPVDSDEEDRENEDDELPNLGSIAARASILKRANSDSIASMSTTTGLPAAKRRFKYTDSSSRKDADVSLRALSPIPASSPPPSFFEGTSRDRPVPTTRSGGLLPSDLDSSEDEGKEKKKQARKKNQAGTSAEPPSQGQPTSEAGPSKLKPLTKKQIQEQERAAKKAAKDLEKAKKAVSRVADLHASYM